MDFSKVEEELGKALGGSKFVKIGSFADLGKALGLEDCGQDDCPVHGKQEAPEPEQRDPLSMRPEEALRFAIHAAAAADVYHTDGENGEARLFQQQAELWLLIRRELDRYQYLQRKDKQERSQIEDLQEDVRELRAENEQMGRHVKILEGRSNERLEQLRDAEQERDDAIRRAEEATQALAELRASGTAPEPVV